MKTESESKNVCPFGNQMQKYWDRRYDLFSLFDQGIWINEEGLYSVTPEKIALHQAEKMNCKTVVDGFCATGGNAIAFARLGSKVCAIERNADRMNMALHNAQIYEVGDKIDFILGDFFEEAAKIKAEGIFLDPSWDGPDHENLEKFSLSNFIPDGEKILKMAFENFPKICLKIPDNFDIFELEKFRKPYEVEDNIMYNRIIFRTVYFL